MTYQELKVIGLAKIEKALSMELPAEHTALYILALALFEHKDESQKESVKV